MCKLIIMLGVGVVLLSGCATIVSGTNETISVNTKPEGATCQLTNEDGTWYVTTTPGTVMIERAYGDLSVVCSEPNYSSTANSVKSSIKPIFFGNLLFGGIIGGCVDFATGAAWNYPSLVSMSLAKVSS